jgi:hypothetical protein
MGNDQTAQPVHDEEPKLNMRLIVDAFARHRLLILCTFIVVLAAAVGYALWQTPICKAEATLTVTAPQGGGLSLSEVPSFLGLSFGSSSVESHRHLMVGIHCSSLDKPALSGHSYQTESTPADCPSAWTVGVRRKPGERLRPSG